MSDSNAVTTVDLLRHGSCEGGEIYRGSTDSTLSEEGWQQMRDALAPAAGWHSIVSSPLSRCRLFADAFGADAQLPVSHEEAFREVHFGEWEGRTAADVAADDAAGLLAWQRGAGRPPGGESIGDVGHRMWEFVTSAAAEHVEACADEARPRTVAVATHAVAIKSAVGAVMRMDLEQWGQMWPAPASLTVLQFAVTPDGQIGERHLLGFAVPTH